MGLGAVAKRPKGSRQGALGQSLRCIGAVTKGLGAVAKVLRDSRQGAQGKSL